MESLYARFDDQKTWDFLGSEKTAGVFQVESAGLTDVLLRLKPHRFETLTDVVALYRPGPMDAGMLDTYIDRSNGKEKVEFDHPLLEPVLKDTYGIILFQEQCLAIANKLAGYTLAEADLFRKAISSKKDEMLEKERGKFLDGCLKANAIEKELATKIFDQIVTFAGYAFNKSHSVCYALISYWTGYLKANYTVEYMASLLSAQSTEDNIRRYIREAKDLGLHVGPPDINHSHSGFSIPAGEDKTIVFGLSKIKGIGEGVAELIIKNRPYKGFMDFISRIDRERVDSRLVQTLLKAGCFRKTETEFTTKQLLENIDAIVGMLKSKKFISPQNAIKRQLKVWEMQKTKSREPLEYSLLELAHMEREKMGFYISTHPLRHLRNPDILLKNPKYSTLANIYDTGKEFFTAGVLTDKVRARKSRRGVVFHELEIEDEQTLVKFPIFGNEHQDILENLKPGDVIALKMRRSKDRVYTEKIKKIDI